MKVLENLQSLLKMDLGLKFFCQVEQSQKLNKFNTFKGRFGFYS